MRFKKQIPDQEAIVAKYAEQDKQYDILAKARPAMTVFRALVEGIDSEDPAVAQLKEAVKAPDQNRKKLADLRARIDRLEKEKAEARKRFEHVKSWNVSCDDRRALIMANNMLIAGGDGKVTAYSRLDGELVWTGSVDGKAYGLAVSDGRLLVATDKGSVHCFGPGTSGGVHAKPEITAEPYPKDKLTEVYGSAADTIVNALPSDQGYALDLGCGDGRLALAIAKRTKLTVIGVESDPAKVKRAREAVSRAGLYGSRVVIHEGSLDKLPYTKWMFNLIVSARTLVGETLPPSAAEAYRVLRPCGGVLAIGQQSSQATGGKLTAWLKSGGIKEGKVTSARNGIWAIVRRGKLAGAGDWSHQYANVANTTCSEDTLVRTPLRMQWFGLPGPNRMFDRHSITHGPVCKNGRLFTPGDKVLYGSDAYNGTLLWEAEIPELEARVNIPRDTGFVAADDNHVYVAAADNCIRINANTGQRVKPYVLPKHAGGRHRWGYVAVDGGTLFGTCVRAHKEDFYRDGRGPWYDQDKKKVIADYIFATGVNDHKLKWKYDGVIVSPTITIGGGRLYFVEHRGPDVLASNRGMISDVKNLALVALDVRTGKKLWEKAPLNYELGSTIFFVTYKDEILTLVRSERHKLAGGVHYLIDALSATQGRAPVAADP